MKIGDKRKSEDLGKAWRDFYMLVFKELKIPQLTDWLNNKLLKLLKRIKRGNLGG